MSQRKPTSKKSFAAPVAMPTEVVVAKHVQVDPETKILALCEEIVPGCDLEPIARAYGLLQALKQMAKFLDDTLEEAVVEKIKADGPFILGEEKFYVAKERTVKCRDVTATYNKLMEVSGGDVAAVLSCLSSNAWKQGSVRALLSVAFPQGAEAELIYNELFLVDEFETVKDGKVTKKDDTLQRIPLLILRKLQQKS